MHKQYGCVWYLFSRTLVSEYWTRLICDHWDGHVKPFLTREGKIHAKCSTLSDKFDFEGLFISDRRYEGKDDLFLWDEKVKQRKVCIPIIDWRINGNSKPKEMFVKFFHDWSKLDKKTNNVLLYCQFLFGWRMFTYH